MNVTGTDTGLAMTAMTDSTIAHAEHTTTTRFPHFEVKPFVKLIRWSDNYDTKTVPGQVTLTSIFSPREKQRLTPLLWLNLSLWLTLMLTLSMATMGMVWDIPMETAWGTPMDRALATTVIPQAMLKASMGMDLDMDTAMVGVTSINQLFSIQNCVTGANDKINIQILSL